MAVLQLAEFLLLVFADSVLTCLRLFLCREFHNVVHNHLAVHRFAHLYLVFLIVMFITSFDNHYYDEENIKIEKVSSGCSISSNQKVELTEEDKNAAREAAIKRLAEEQYRLLKKKPAKKKADANVQQMSLF